MTTKVAANSVLNFVRSYLVNCCGMLCIWTLEGQAFIQGPECTPSTSLTPPKHIYMSPLLTTASFSQLTNTVLIHLHYPLLWGSLWVEISTLAYEANYSCWSEMLSVAYCTHIIQTKLMLKNRRYPQNSRFTATEGPTDMPLVVLE